MIHKYRDLIQRKCLFQCLGIHLHIADDHSNLTAAISILPHISAHLLRRRQCFFPRLSRHMDLNRILLSFISFFPIAEKISFQKCKCRIITETIRDLIKQLHGLFDLDLIFFRQLYHGCNHMFTKRK